MSQVWSQHSSARQGLLGAAGAVLARNPGAAMAEIAALAGVGRATLYRHFPTREDLIRALALESLRQSDEAAKRIPIERSSAERVLAEVWGVAAWKRDTPSAPERRGTSSGDRGHRASF